MNWFYCRFEIRVCIAGRSALVTVSFFCVRNKSCCSILPNLSGSAVKIETEGPAAAVQFRHSTSTMFALRYECRRCTRVDIDGPLSIVSGRIFRVVLPGYVGNPIEIISIRTMANIVDWFTVTNINVARRGKALPCRNVLWAINLYERPSHC